MGINCIGRHSEGQIGEDVVRYIEKDIESNNLEMKSPPETIRIEILDPKDYLKLEVYYHLHLEMEKEIML